MVDGPTGTCRTWECPRWVRGSKFALGGEVVGSRTRAAASTSKSVVGPVQIASRGELGQLRLQIAGQIDAGSRHTHGPKSESKAHHKRGTQSQVTVPAVLGLAATTSLHGVTPAPEGESFSGALSLTSLLTRFRWRAWTKTKTGKREA